MGHKHRKHGLLCPKKTVAKSAKRKSYRDLAEAEPRKSRADTAGGKTTGETPIHTFARANEAALDVIRQYGLIGGEHHKNWVLNEVVKALCSWYPEPGVFYDCFVSAFDESDADSEEPENAWREMVRDNCVPP